MRQAFGFLAYYVARRLLGVLARTIDRYDQRERERIEAAKRDARKNPGTWFPARRSVQDGPSTPETTTGPPDQILSPHRTAQETP